MQTELIKSRDLKQVLGLSKSTIYRLAKEHQDFPRPIKLSSNSVLWDVKAIKEWLVKNYQVNNIAEVVTD